MNRSPRQFPIKNEIEAVKTAIEEFLQITEGKREQRQANPAFIDMPFEGETVRMVPNLFSWLGNYLAQARGYQRWQDEPEDVMLQDARAVRIACQQHPRVRYEVIDDEYGQFVQCWIE